MNFPEELKYAKSHEWLKLDGNTATIGVTDFAQHELGDVTYLDFTVQAGSEVQAGESLGTIEAVKTVSEFYAPVSGKVIEVNDKINDNPSVMNNEPYGEGWIIKIEPNNMDEVNNLLDSTSYKELAGV